MSGIQTTSNSKALKATAMPFKKTRAWLFSCLALTITAYGVWIMFDILNSNGMTPLEYALLALFTVTFGLLQPFVVAVWASSCNYFVLTR